MKIKPMKQIVVKAAVASVFCVGIFQPVFAGELEECMVRALTTEDDSMTIGELRLKCKAKIRGVAEVVASADDQKSGVEEHVILDRKNALQPFTLMAHKNNYLLFASYNASSYNEDPFKIQFKDPGYQLDNVEAKFQLSVKFPLLVKEKFDIYAAYTNRSFWQVYNSKESAPFRETNHEPEAWVQFHPNWKFLGFTNGWNSFGFVHQSNGRGGTLSRSWNRIYGWFTVGRGNLSLSIKPWYRIPEDAEDDNNPDITDYLGHYEVMGTYKWKKHAFRIMSRNNLESGFSRGAVELSWSFPFLDWPYLKGYVQYFNGYGESMIDYNQHSNSIGIGISMR